MSKISILQNNIPDNLDAILLTSDISRRYITGFNYTDGYVVVSRNMVYLLADFRFIEAAKAYETDEVQVIMMKGKYFEQLTRLFAEINAKNIGYEDTMLTCSEFERLRSGLNELNLCPMGALLDDQREIKENDEIEKITAAQRIAEKGFCHMLDFIKPDMTEKEVALELEFFMRKNGAEASAFDIIAVSGSASSMPHGVPRDVKLEKGFLTLDFGAVVDGYLSDMTRTIVLGKADEEMKSIYNTVFEAQLRAIEFISAGKTGEECDKAARDIIDNAGFRDCFGHGLGHGVGMYIHESPRLSPAGKKVLRPGHVVTVEPGIYIAGKYGVRIEDMVVVTENGNVNLTLADKSLIEL